MQKQKLYFMIKLQKVQEVWNMIKKTHLSGIFFETLHWIMNVTELNFISWSYKVLYLYLYTTLKIYKYILSTNKNEKGINPRKLSRETKWSILLATFFYARPYFTAWIDGLDIILFILTLAFKTIKSLIKCCFCI